VYDLGSKRTKFSVHNAYFFLKLKMSPVKRLS